MIEQKRFGAGDGYYANKKRTNKQKKRTAEIASKQRAEKAKIAATNNAILVEQQRTDQAFMAGGSRPMHQGTTSQIDPMTGMPMQGNAPQMGNFGGAMNASNVPLYNQSMSPGQIAQQRYDAEKADINNNGVTEDWEKAKASKFTVAQDKKQIKTGIKTNKNPKSFSISQGISTKGDTLSYKVVKNYIDSDGFTVNKKIPISNKKYNKLKDQ